MKLKNWFATNEEEEQKSSMDDEAVGNEPGPIEPPKGPPLRRLITREDFEDPERYGQMYAELLQEAAACEYELAGINADLGLKTALEERVAAFIRTAVRQSDANPSRQRLRDAVLADPGYATVQNEVLELKARKEILRGKLRELDRRQQLLSRHLEVHRVNAGLASTPVVLVPRGNWPAPRRLRFPGERR